MTKNGVLSMSYTLVPEQTNSTAKTVQLAGLSGNATMDTTPVFAQQWFVYGKAPFDFVDLVKECKELRQKYSQSEERAQFLADFLDERLPSWRDEYDMYARKRVLREAGLIPIEDVIAKARSTPEGEKAWQEAERVRDQELKERLNDGEISRIKYHRLLKKMQQGELAERVGTQQPNIARYERIDHQGRVRVQTLEKIAAALEVNVKDLLL